MGDPERQPFRALLSQCPITGQLSAATRQKPPLMRQTPAFVASVPPEVQSQTPQSTGQLSAWTVQESPLLLQVPAFLASVPSEVHSQTPQETTGGFARVQVPEFAPPWMPSQRHR